MGKTIYLSPVADISVFAVNDVISNSVTGGAYIETPEDEFNKN